MEFLTSSCKTVASPMRQQRERVDMLGSLEMLKLSDILHLGGMIAQWTVGNSAVGLLFRILASDIK